jgi:hypothetical protein
VCGATTTEVHVAAKEYINKTIHDELIGIAARVVKYLSTKPSGLPYGDFARYVHRFTKLLGSQVHVLLIDGLIILNPSSTPGSRRPCSKTTRSRNALAGQEDLSIMDNEEELLEGLRPEFTPQLLNYQGRVTSAAVRRLFSECLTHLNNLIPPSREHSLALTKLQESCMWSIRAVSLDLKNVGPKEA